MKITILGPAYPFRGGIAALNERLAKELIKEGHQVDIVSFKLQYPSFLFPGKSQFTDQPQKFTFRITREINSINPINWILTGRKIKKAEPDLLIVRFWIPFMAMSLGSICRIVKSSTKTTVISIADNIIPHEKRIGDDFLCNYFIKSVDGFLTMSESVLSDLTKFSNKKPALLSPHPIYDHYGEIEPREIALEKLSLSADFRYILFFGFIRDYKGLDLLLKAFAHPFFRENKIKLIVAGEFYSDEAVYTNMISDLNIGDIIELRTDYIANSDVPNYFNCVDIVTQPYKSATQSGVTQIAYHFNKPMLVTDVGGLAEIVPNLKAGYVVKPHPSEIAEALIDFFSKNRLDEFVKNVIIEKKRFSWDKMTSSIYHLAKRIGEDVKISHK
ncbi:MAG TPA: glycosyl transferase family 1 [Prolixibacteraceae bacterium]|nr:glycosyl transferase family 1 [Prolixibacteraceae bacterium]